MPGSVARDPLARRAERTPPIGLRILHVVPSYWPATRYGGPVYSVHGLCRALVHRGHRVEVFTTNIDGVADSSVPLGRPVDFDSVRVWYWRSPKLRRLFWSPSLAGALRGRLSAFDLVHLHSVFLWPTTAAARIARRTGVPYVLSPRGMLVKDLVRRRNRLLKTAWIALNEKTNIRRAAAIHVTTDLEEQELSRFGFELPTCRVVPNGVESPGGWYRDDLSGDIEPLLDNRPFVLYLGRLSWKKGLENLVESARLIPGIGFVIAGIDEGCAQDLHRLAHKHRLGERVFIVDRWIHGADKAALLRSASVFVLPSISENFGNAVVEAVLAGTPVVVTPQVGVSDLIERAGAGLVAAGNPESLAEAIQTLLRRSDPGVDPAAKAMVETHYSWDAVAQQMESLYIEALGRPVSAMSELRAGC